MTPFLKLLVLVVILAGFVIGLINVVRKSKNPSVKLRWVLIPFFISIVSLIVNQYVIHNGWDMKTLINEFQSTNRGTDSLETEKFNSKNKTQKRKNVKKVDKNKNEYRTGKDTLNVAQQEQEQTNQQLASRMITPEQINNFVSYLKGKPKGPFRIIYPSGDYEAFEYSKLVSKMLTEAGYIRSGRITSIAGSEAENGISVVINANETQPVYAKSVFYAFLSIGIDAKAVRDKRLVKPLELLIFVGHQ